MFYFTILLIISNILWENIDTILLLLCTTIYKIFISFFAQQSLNVLFSFHLEMLEDLTCFDYSALSPGEESLGGTTNGYLEAGSCKWAARHHRHRHATSLYLSPLVLQMEILDFTPTEITSSSWTGQDRGIGSKKNNEKYLHNTLTAIFQKFCYK